MSEGKLLADGKERTRSWAKYYDLHNHLFKLTESLWVVEQDNHIIGYARRIGSNEMVENIELVVFPDMQDDDVAQVLLSRISTQ